MKRITKKQLKAAKDSIKDINSPLIFLEGFRLLDSIQDTDIITMAIAADSFSKNPEKINAVEKLSCSTEVLLCTDSQLSYLSGLKNPDGLLVSVMKKSHPVEDFYSADRAAGVLLDNIQDPGNLGTIIRTCYGFGIKGLFLYGKHCSPYNPKCIRASMGTIIRMPVFTHGQFCIRDFDKRGFKLYKAVKDKESSAISDISFADRCIIAFGNEGHGFSNELRALRGNGFYIPVRKELDSLNLATCVGITVFFTECLFRHKA